ncbi:amino acid permease [Ferrimonas lipolytica]|uniref:Amino acid permease n=1 Tax=Ferrimonas lipolytica TaxID=2724191 RepID=A0A6H1UI50_9GAMM|nr:aromatic amino acid transport family protein [Ferrimonas lipolytica]QIZ78761.1 amino acid permease [Ferrimonas lipolytica]
MNRSKFVGATLIVAGTSIGAGMLALPLATAAIGFWPAMALMAVTWALSAYSALLMLEVNLKTGENLNLHSMTGKVLGPQGQWLGMAAMLALLYALTAAYLSGGSSLLLLKLNGFVELSPTVGAILFAILLGSLVAGGVKYIDAATRVLFTIKMIALGVVLCGLLPQLDLSYVAATGSADTNVWMAVVPVLITSFGFHVCIPTLVRYLDGDVVTLRRALLTGSLLPMVCYGLWLLAALGSLSMQERAALSEGDALVTLVQSLSAKSQWSGIGQALTLFADLALITSFFGVSLSLFDYLAELFRLGKNATGRVLNWGLTFVPPLVLAVFFPGGFVAVLGYAAVPLIVLMVVLPVMMARQLRRQQREPEYQVRGGNMALNGATFAGTLVIAAQLYTSW